MKLKLFFLFLFLSFKILLSQDVEVIPLRYGTSGYMENSQSYKKESTQRLARNNQLIPSINSEMNVSESGALTYVLPIETIKTANDFQPNISIAYNSQSGNGQIGWGWNIIGLSVISEGGKSKLIDGTNIGPQFDGKDPFYLDGQRLIDNGNNTFSTEVFSKIKVSKINSGEFSFIVQYTDGKVAKYKPIVRGQHYISEITDAYNNSIRYLYSTDDNIPRLTKVIYGNNSFFIDFSYVRRKNEVQAYRNGNIFINKYILSEIISGSVANGTYRKYNFEYDLIEDGKTERLRTINIENEYAEKLKPLTFNYNVSSAAEIIKTTKQTPALPNNTDGLGSVAIGDFLIKGEITPIYQIRKNKNEYSIFSNIGAVNYQIKTRGKDDFYSGKALHNNKISENDNLITVSTEYVDDNLQISESDILTDRITFHINNLHRNTYRNLSIELKGDMYYQPPSDPYSNDEDTPVRYTRPRDFISGDFNNDGLIDFLIYEPKTSNLPEQLYFIEIGKSTSSVAEPIKIQGSINKNSDTDVHLIEFDGDSFPEIMTVNNKTKILNVYKLDLLAKTINPILANYPLSNFSDKTPLFFGDFNGDGLTDFITPQKVYDFDENNPSSFERGYAEMENSQHIWWKYTGNGKTFIKKEENYTEQKLAYIVPKQSHVIKRTSFWQKFWNGKPDEYLYSKYATTAILITDFNGDGRSDIISVSKVGKAKYDNDGKLVKTDIQNQPIIHYQVDRDDDDDDNPTYIRTISSFANVINFYENQTLNGGTFSKIQSIPINDTKISPLSLIIPFSDSNQLNTYKTGLYIHDPITRSDIRYTVNNDNFLEKQITSVDNGSNVLQKIEYRPMIPSKKKDEATYIYQPNGNFEYPYYIHHTNGSYYLVSKIHTLFNNKIISKEYRYQNAVQMLDGKGFIGFQKSFVSDPYESELKNNTYINKDPYAGLFWTITTRDPKMENAITKSTYGGLNVFFTETTMRHKRFEKGNHSYLILATEEFSKDNLKKINISKKYIYDEADDLKLKKAFTDYNSIQSSETSYEYKPEFSNGNKYFYGKISAIENTNYRDGLSFKTREETDYNTLGAISQKRSFGNQANAPPIITSFTYDNVGNILTETLSTTGIASQTTSYGYDTSKRFVIKTTTPDGLSATADVDYLGRVYKEVSSLGLSTSYKYDSWGNITEITDFLGKKTTIAKKVSNVLPEAVYSLHKKRDGGTESIAVFDQFDREIETRTQSLKGKWIVQRTEYDIFGKKIRYSEPFFDGETPKWNSIEYDELNRPIKNIAFTDKVITTCYEGMKVTVDDGYKKTSKTLDATGNTVRHEDHGGIIHYQYYPNGSLRETNYDGIKTTFEIDGRGNKIKMTDPSAGIFTYQYDNLGRMVREDNPKGYTLFTFDNLGRPLTEKTFGKTSAEKTDIQKTYTYNAQTKLPETISGTANGKTFTYTTYYDQYYRIKGKKEQTPDFTYSSSTTYDSFGRADIISTTVTLVNPNYTTKSNIKNIYDANGILIRQDDTDARKMIWEISETNALGQATEMHYGNGYNISTTYSTKDFSLQKINHTHTTTGVNILDIEYNYDVNKGVLNSRNFATFNKNETFTYDKLNRLLTESLNGTLQNQYTYDQRGRMTSNSELGRYNYHNGNYKLQNINFNEKGTRINQERGFAEISYNAFKAPIVIKQNGKDELHFEYNILKTRYAMASAVSGKQKLYSSDFAIEITRHGNKTEIISFITGDPYSANYIKKEILTGNALSSTNHYYLHRNNLGSIVAITNSRGDVVEKRFFDAWGNLKAGTMAITDRGYTGHEHLPTLGLINMNARIYDPILRRFLSADNEISDAYNTQAYDRYSYVLNNPLLYVDPSGNSPLLLAAIIFAGSMIQHAISNMINNIPFWYGMGKAATMTIVSSAISFGIGSITKNIADIALKALAKAGLHGISSGMMNVLNDAKFISGFASGAISSLITSGVEVLGDSSKSLEGISIGMVGGSSALIPQISTFASRNPTLMKAILLTSGGLSGGISSSIAGGKFIDGFKQGIIVAGMNHLAHWVANEIEYKEKLKQFLIDRNIDPSEKPTQAILDSYKKIFKEYWDDSAQYAEFANADTISEWEKGDSMKLSINTNGSIRIGNMGTGWGVTNSLGQVILAPGIRSNYMLASVFIHEMRHSIDYVSGFYLLIWQLPNVEHIMEYRAYYESYKWTGIMNRKGFYHKSNLRGVPPFLLIK